MSRLSLPRTVALLACAAGLTAGIARPAMAEPSPADPAAPVQPAAAVVAITPAQPAASEPAPSQPAPSQPTPAQSAPSQSAPAQAPEPAPTRTVTAEPKPAKKPAGPADIVAVVRTGGITGGMAVFTLIGANNRHNALILRLASSPEFRALRSSYVPANTCCDRYSYKVEVTYRNGVKKKITVLAGTPGTPPVLLNVIRLMETMSAPKPVAFSGFPFN